MKKIIETIRNIIITLIVFGIFIAALKYPIIAIFLILIVIGVFALAVIGIAYGLDNKFAESDSFTETIPLPDEQNISNSSEQPVEDSQQAESDIQ